MTACQDSPISIDSFSVFFVVRDVGEAIRFYREAFGFDLLWHWPGPEENATVGKDGLSIGLRCDDERVAGQSHVFCQMTGIDGVYRRCLEAGAHIAMELDQADPNIWVFTAADPSGNLIGFCENKQARPMPAAAGVAT